SDRPGGYGGRDIYRIVKLPNGDWSRAQNMGPDINTPYDEDSPFIAVNNKTLYYSSNGDKSMGGFDVFVTFVYFFTIRTTLGYFV
ncbi:MAG: PD40 domain-containing protein, partial [Algicola sp.]|nr:PD40 domain-containing protein [Algicola sp.]